MLFIADSELEKWGNSIQHRWNVVIMWLWRLLHLSIFCQFHGLPYLSNFTPFPADGSRVYRVS